MLANYVHVSFRKLRQRRPWPFISGISSGTTTSVELLLLVLHDLSSINLSKSLGFKIQGKNDFYITMMIYRYQNWQQNLICYLGILISSTMKERFWRFIANFTKKFCNDYVFSADDCSSKRQAKYFTLETNSLYTVERLAISPIQKKVEITTIPWPME